MQRFIEDCIDMLRFSVSWVYDKEARMPFFMIPLVIIIGAIVVFGGTFLFGMANPFLAFLFMLVSMFLATIAFLYVSYKIIPYSLAKKGFKPIEYGIMPLIRSIIALVVASIASFLPWFDMKLLVINVVLALGVVGLIVLSVFMNFGLGLLLIIPILLALSITWCYAWLRLAFTLYAFFLGNGVVGSVRKSWELTDGKLTKVYSRIWLTWGFVYGGIYSVIGVIILPVYFLMIVSVFLNPTAFLVMMGLMYVLMILIGVPATVFGFAYLFTSAYSMLEAPQGGQGVAAASALPGPAPAPPPTLKKGSKKEKIYDQY
ncbi:MAG: hypothetical protein ABIF01_00915 [Candidatus Micrarchaeota archaeon]